MEYSGREEQMNLWQETALGLVMWFTVAFTLGTGWGILIGHLLFTSKVKEDYEQEASE